jgi:hypothetical protein
MSAVASAARACVALDKAQRIATWVGGGKPVTPKGVLRPVDVHQAADAVGVAVPTKFRSAGDVPAWHRLWSVAVATGMVVIEHNRAVAASPVDVTPDLWLRALAATLAVSFDDDEGVASLRIGRVALTALVTGKAGTSDDLQRVVWDEFTHDSDANFWRLWGACGYDQAGPLLVELFAEFGAIADEARLTELGQWALAQLITRGDGITEGFPAVSTDRICQLKITLKDVRPACWRRVLVPAGATLGNLHWIIQAAMRWDDDHLHGFTVGRNHYGDPGYDMTSEDGITVGGAFTRSRKTICYTYDFGDDWRHDIALETTLDANAGTTYPVCVAGNGSVPVEDSWDQMIEFDQEDINHRLRALR